MNCPSPNCSSPRTFERSRERIGPLVLLAATLSALLPGTVACGPGEPASEVLAEFQGLGVGDLLGAHLAAAGDLDGDGHPDLLAGASQFATAGASPGYVLALSGVGGPPLYTLQGLSGGDGFGATLVSVGDVDDDGVPDVAVGAPRADTGRPDAGSVHLFSGRTGTPLWVAHGERGGDALGIALAPLGDVDEDGVPDLAAAALQPAMGPDRDAGAGYVMALSGATGLPLFTVRGDDQTRDFGRQLAPLSDINGDGLPDLAVSAPASQVVLYLSGRTGSVLQRMEDLGAGFGSALAAAGDMDGDGHGDLIVGAPLDSHAAALAGAIHVLNGVDGTPLLIARGTESGLRLGVAVAPVPDLDGDGIPEIATAPTGGGAVRILSGADGHELRRLEPGPDQHDFGIGLTTIGDPDGHQSAHPSAQGPAHLAVGFPGIGPLGNSAGGVLIVALRR